MIPSSASSKECRSISFRPIRLVAVAPLCNKESAPNIQNHSAGRAACTFVLGHWMPAVRYTSTSCTAVAGFDGQVDLSWEYVTNSDTRSHLAARSL